jgi:hypothetical protein
VRVGGVSINERPWFCCAGAAACGLEPEADVGALAVFNAKGCVVLRKALDLSHGGFQVLVDEHTSIFGGRQACALC